MDAACKGRNHRVSDKGFRSAARGGGVPPAARGFELHTPAPGYRDFGNGTLYLIGFGGFDWISAVVAADSPKTLYLGFGDNGLTPQGNNHRAFGFPVRCLQE